ncbi:MAG: type II toxin-antitoxin system CcdA family antitoxin [Pseudomonadota bacterium]
MADENESGKSTPGSSVVRTVNSAKEAKWKEENRIAIQAHNQRIQKHGVFLKLTWVSNLRT